MSILFIFLFFLSSLNVFAEESRVKEYGNYDDAIKIIQEVMKDYYIRGERLQYNYSRAGYGSYSPEEATIQDNKHLVCASYTYSSYVEAFGVSSSSSFPPYNYSITDAASAYYNENKNNPSKLDGNLLIYYQNTSVGNQAKYIYNHSDANNVSVSEFAQMIQPGDLFTYSGHAMIAYDIVQRTPGNWDVLMFTSLGCT